MQVQFVRFRKQILPLFRFSFSNRGIQCNIAHRTQFQTRQGLLSFDWTRAIDCQVRLSIRHLEKNMLLATYNWDAVQNQVSKRCVIHSKAAVCDGSLFVSLPHRVAPDAVECDPCSAWSNLYQTLCSPPTSRYPWQPRETFHNTQHCVDGYNDSTAMSTVTTTVKCKLLRHCKQFHTTVMY